MAVMVTLAHYFAITCANQKSEEQRKQKEYEKKLVLLNEQLESNNKLLQDSHQKLEFSLSERENFILRFSHEIRNPLNCVLGNLELSLDTTSDQSTREMLQEAKVCGEILLQLLNNVLDTGKVATGRLEISRKAHNIKEFLERMWVISSEIIHKKGLLGILCLSKRMPTYIEFDGHRMMQIIINLVSNAAKFTKSGSVNMYFDFEETDTLSDESMRSKYKKLLTPQDEDLNERFYTCFDWQCEPTIENSHEVLTASNKKFSTKKDSFPRPFGQPEDIRKGYIRIEIADTGCGIKNEDLDTLFTKFGQVHHDSSMRQVGTGLGLWITRELVEVMEGKIKAYSIPGQGTVFVIAIKSEIPTTQYSSTQTLSVRKDTPKTLIKSRALVVDDMIYNREINCKFFTKAGITETEMAENGLQAIEIFISKGPSYFTLISVDLDMPIMDGRAAIRTLRDYEQRRGWNPIPIIVITAYSESKTMDELLDPKGVYRASSFLSKPTSFSVIQKTIEELVQSSEIVTNKPKKELQQRPIKEKDLVLIADDDKFNQLTLVKMFKHVGFECITASSGDEAIREFQKHGPNLCLVLTDCGMNPVDGFTAASEIRAIMNGPEWNKLKQIPIIGISGNQGAEFEKKCLESGMIKFFTKPISLSLVQELVSDHI